MNLKYVILSPVRNEADHLPRTIDSILSQSCRPSQWIVINDGSTDRTGEILDQAASQTEWITPVHLEDRGYRKSGAGVVEALCIGLTSLQISDWDFLVKLDGDVSFESDYFEACISEFEKVPRLGIGGGFVCHSTADGLVPEASDDPPFHVRGASKIYRRECWDAIGGLIEQTGWDTMDEVKANMLGWETRSFPDIQLVHHKQTGAADGDWKNAVKNGFGSYLTGYHPLFLVARCVKRANVKPYVVHSLGLLTGFIGGYVRRSPRLQEEEVTRYIRRQQLRRLFGKSSIYRPFD